MKANPSNSNPFESNPYTGRHAPGFRFLFHVRSVAYCPLYLPLSMRQLPQIQRLLKGESPLVIFNRHSISSAREAFNELRKQFDFAYWAIKDYYIHDIKDADNIIPLNLNIPTALHPLFLDYTARAAHPDDPANHHPLHIDLDQAWRPSKNTCAPTSPAT